MGGAKDEARKKVSIFIISDSTHSLLTAAHPHTKNGPDFAFPPTTMNYNCLLLLLTAFDARATSAKELCRRLKAPRFHKANPKLKVIIDNNARPDPPSVNFKLVNDLDVSATKSIYMLLLLLLLLLHKKVVIENLW